MAISDVLAHVDGQAGWLRELYEHFHRHPELAHEEHGTAARIEQELSALGLTPQRVGQTGVVAVVENDEGPTVMARGDIDGLSITEKTGLEYASQTPGVMHACGHDVHAVALLGAVRLLTEHREAWSGTYVALFQPAEETATGARAMLDDGLTERVPTPDVVFGQHVMTSEAGSIGITSGPVLSVADTLKVTVFGKATHASMPHRGVDPAVLAASVILQLQTIVSRELQPGALAVVSVPVVSVGRTANMIPESAELTINVRTYTPDVRERVLGAIERVVRSQSSAANSPREPEIEHESHFPITVNDDDATSRVIEAFVEAFGDDRVHGVEPATGSEDFSYIPDAFAAPYVYWTIGTVEPQTYRTAMARGTVAEDIPPNHSPYFAPEPELTLRTGVESHVAATLAYLSA